MFTVELYARIRRAVMVDGLSWHEAAPRGYRRLSPDGNQTAPIRGLEYYQGALPWNGDHARRYAVVLAPL